MDSAVPSHGVALLGAGIFAKTAHLPALAATPNFRLLAIYSRSSASTQSLEDSAREYKSTSHSITAYHEDEFGNGGLKALLAREDIKTVIVSLPILVQPSVVEAAFASGKNVISEKPVAKDLEAALGLIRHYEKEYLGQGLAWIVAEQFPYEVSFCKAKKMLESGTIGELRSVSLEFYTLVETGSKYYETPWRKTPEYQGGFLLDGGVHLAAGLRHMLPSPLKHISAVSSLIQPHLAPFDTLHSNLVTVSGVTGSMTISFGIESCAKRIYTFRGSKGTLEVDFSQPRHVISFTPLAKDSAVQTTEYGRGVEEEFAAFGKALVAGVSSEEYMAVQAKSGPRAAANDLAVIEGALRSSEQKREIDLLEMVR